MTQILHSFLARVKVHPLQLVGEAVIRNLMNISLFRLTRSLIKI